MEREMENTLYTHTTTPPQPPHTQEHLTIQDISSHLEHGDGDGAYTPTPTTNLHPPPPPPHTQEHLTIQVISSQLEHGDGAYTHTPTTHHHPNS